jgi:RNA polymerase sigma-70 factor (ECF subfamily)
VAVAAISDERAVDPARFRKAGEPHAGNWAFPPRPWPTPEEHALDREALAVVRTAIDTLPLPQREVISLRDILGWTATEVCDALDLTEVNQRVLLHRARSRVRALLERHYDRDQRNEAGGR